jgi:hypothetical protein
MRIPRTESKRLYLELMEEMCERCAGHMRGTELEQEEEELRGREEALKKREEELLVRERELEE